MKRCYNYSATKEPDLSNEIAAFILLFYFSSTQVLFCAVELLDNVSKVLAV